MEQGPRFPTRPTWPSLRRVGRGECYWKLRTGFACLLLTSWPIRHILEALLVPQTKEGMWTTPCFSSSWRQPYAANDEYSAPTASCMSTGRACFSAGPLGVASAGVMKQVEGWGLLRWQPSDDGKKRVRKHKTSLWLFAPAYWLKHH
jgi:hypothetical protein